MEGNGHVNKRSGMMQALVVPVLFLSTILLFAGCVSKQDKMATTGTVKGVLKDQQGQPVPDAVVMVAGGTGSFSDMAALTDRSGEFYLSNITLPGSYTLQIQLAGASVQKTVQVASAADTIMLTY